MLRHSNDFRLADFKISSLTVTERAEKIVEDLESATSLQKPSAVVVALNLENAYFLSKRKNYLEIADLFVADGWPIQLLAKIKDRCTGLTFAPCSFDSAPHSRAI